MSTLVNDRSRAVLAAVLGLSRLQAGDLGDLSVARRILEVVRDVVPGADPRVAFTEGDHVLAFGPGPDDDATLRVARAELTPVVATWMRQLGDERSSGLRGRPDGLASVLDDAAHDGPVVALRVGTEIAGFVAAGVAQADVETTIVLGAIAEQAGTVLENARLYRRLEREAETDGLTHAYNYRYFMRALAREMDRVRRHGGELAVVMVDVDNLKEYNDAFGHLGGSAALREIAALLHDASRSIDVVAKYGGDEFSLLLPECGAAGALAFCDRVRRTIAAHEFEEDAARHLTVSMGIAVFPTEGSDPHDLLRVADARLYEAKRAGRNRVGGLS